MLPLEGIKVVELGQNLAGPFTGQILAHLGADVIKIERPESGDDARAWGPPFIDGTSALFNAVNLSKRSVALNLKDEDARAWLLALIAEVDVVVQNMRPGTLKRFGLDGETLTARFPHLVYCSLSAFGEVGPLGARPGYEPVVQAFSGLMMLCGEEGGPPTRIGTQVLDHGSAMWAAIGILAALLQRRQSGTGSLVECSLLETALGWLTTHNSGYSATGKRPTRHPTGSPRVVPFEAFEAADGPILISAANERLFAKLAAALGHEEWAADPRYQGNEGRAKHRGDLLAAIGAVVAAEPAEHWVQALEAAGVPVSRINTFDQILDHPQVEALDMLRRVEQVDLRLMSLPLRFDGERPPIRSRAPKVGEHTADVQGEVAASAPLRAGGDD